MAFINQLALISESPRISLEQLVVVSAALQKQATRDLKPIWDVDSTVDSFARLEDVPLGYWPMIIMDDIGFDAAGIHLDRDGQPYALISADDDTDVWSLTASHECLEMLVDPYGNRLVAGDSPKSDQGRVMFLVEVCDPSEAAQFGYSVNGVLVSDFYTPQYFDPIVSTGVRYSFTDAITEPRFVLQGGYLSWFVPGTGEWWQETWFSGNKSRFVNLGKMTEQSGGSIRSFIDKITAEQTHKAIAPARSVAKAAGLTASRNLESTTSRADALHQQIDELLAKGNGNAPNGGRRESGAVRGGRGPRKPRQRD